MRYGCGKAMLFFLALAGLFFWATGGEVRAGLAADQTEFQADSDYLRDQRLLDQLQRDTFRYMWERAYPESGLAFENNRYVDGPATTSGTGFGIAAIVAATDRGWITRREALDRLLKIVVFLRDRTERGRLHGAFPHWINGVTGATMPFGPKDIGGDVVETAFLMQGLLIARAYFTGADDEARLRDIITGLWHDVDWNWFTRGEDNGLFWHWSPEYGFEMNMKVAGFNEGMVAYVLALASPTHPISRKAYNYWSSTPEYLPQHLYGYDIEAAIPDTGPLFITHYSYIGLDPRQISDEHVRRGYWVRNVTQTLINRAYCLEAAPAENRYGEGCWGLTSCDTREYYRYAAPGNEIGTIAPTAALSAMPYVPEYSLRVLWNLYGNYRDQLWGPCGPYDAFSLKENWFARTYQAIDQLPIMCMVENYRSGLLWRLFMGDQDVRKGLERADLRPPRFGTGFPEMVIALRPDGSGHAPDACDLRRRPDTGLYEVSYFAELAGEARFTLTGEGDLPPYVLTRQAAVGRNTLAFPQFTPKSDQVWTLRLSLNGQNAELPIRMN